MRKLVMGIPATACCATVAITAPGVANASGPGSGGAPTTISAGDTQTGTTQYWGWSPTSGSWHDKLFTSTAAAVSRAAVLQQSESRKAVDPQFSAGGFVCGLHVDNLNFSDGRLNGRTLGTCSGDFVDQDTSAQFKVYKKTLWWSSWKNFSGVLISDVEDTTSQAWRWWRYCPGTASHAYQMVAFQRVWDDSGTPHTGPNVHALDNKHAPCGG